MCFCTIFSFFLSHSLHLMWSTSGSCPSLLVTLCMLLCREYITSLRLHRYQRVSQTVSRVRSFGSWFKLRGREDEKVLLHLSFVSLSFGNERVSLFAPNSSLQLMNLRHVHWYSDDAQYLSLPTHFAIAVVSLSKPRLKFTACPGLKLVFPVYTA